MGLLARLGLDARLRSEGLTHDGFSLADGGRTVRIDLAALTGRRVTVYGQTEIVRDLIEAAPSRGLEIVYGAEDVTLHDIDTDRPHVRYCDGASTQRVNARFVVGADGFHGPSRRAIPVAAVREFDRTHPSAWLGILADVPPCDNELIYASHERGFALASMRSRTRSRYYIDVPATDRLDDWPDERIWDELSVRLGPDAGGRIIRGPAIERSLAPLRSYVHEPMRHGSLLLCGDSAHIVPPTGAKGLNLAASDAVYAAEALVAYLRRGDGEAIAGYSARALARVWKAEVFSWAMTRLTHRFPGDQPFDRALRVAELDYIAGSRAAQARIAESYVGLPL